MSEFRVDYTCIEEVRPHPNADRLELAKVQDLAYQFVIPRGQYAEGDAVAYFPIDAVLPPDLIEFMGLTGRLSGPQKNRVKTIKLRGEISQGLVEHISNLVLGGFFLPEYPSVGVDLAEALGVVKYEPPVTFDNNGKRINALPDGVEVYDIESCERHERMLGDLLDSGMPVLVTEKLEGAHISCTVRRSGEMFVCSRRCTIEQEEGVTNPYYQAALTYGLDRFARELLEDHNKDSVTVRGELIGPGVQGNIYGLLKHQVRIFDVLADGKYMDALNIYHELDPDHYVPVLYYGTLRGWLQGRSVAEASNGRSVLNPSVSREGVVIRPFVEIYFHGFQRMILKQRSPEYLAAEVA